MKISITGTPGVGKSTVSKILVEKLKEFFKNDFIHINITEVVKENRLYSEKDEEMDSYVVDFKKLNDFIDKISKKSENIILDGHLSHSLDSNYTIVLRCNPEILIKRLRERGYSEKKVMENVQAEILDVCLAEAIENQPHSENSVYEIDTTNRSSESIVNEIVTALKNKESKVGCVNWLDDYFYLLE
nr:MULTISPECIES: AAA family ATPase [Methanothermococcus]